MEILLAIRPAVAFVVGHMSQLRVARGTGEMLGVPLTAESIQDLGQDGFLAGSTHSLSHSADSVDVLHVHLQRAQHVAEVIHGRLGFLIFLLSTVGGRSRRFKVLQVLHELVEFQRGRRSRDLRPLDGVVVSALLRSGVKGVIVNGSPDLKPVLTGRSAIISKGHIYKGSQMRI